MKHLLCRNRVRDYSRWREIFDADATAHQQAGLSLLNIWQNRDDENEVFCLFEVRSDDLAADFLESAVAAHKAEKAGVVDADFHFLEPARIYRT